MQTIQFTIPGNHEASDGHPVPYERSTQAGFWKPRVRRYSAWKDYVRSHFDRHTRLYGLPVIISDDGKAGALLTNGRQLKPIQTKRKCRMDIFITYKNHAHPDSDNVWKGIADALFYNDKNVAGSFDFTVDSKAKPGVKVTITIPTNEGPK